MFTSDAGERAAQKGAAASMEDEEDQHFLLARWLRQRVLRATNK